ncbi:uncharacterized protein BJ171DRAFT_491094 [Polychytrium aggregatum]|uniref:uncharacterized protein n=1 Tax=Polychytrium aggregatum TaxID=110093 RepID=UPI0022FDFDCE|nr:uncharacterized protein BJ171DRAFT_491094 [Polychytrium aggregatum]KAI9208359.1 hypothetical protein BJ171DRAFT_491094 [Polychytrium aggregatum]
MSSIQKVSAEDIPSGSANGPDNQQPLDELWQKVSANIHNAVHQAVESIRSVSFYPNRSDSDTESSGSPDSFVHFLGILYPSLEDPAFLDDFRSRLWITYRYSFPPIKPSTYTSDVGWGCMLRSGQMLLASAFVLHYLGRDWRLVNNSDKPTMTLYSKIVSWFLDSNSSPYSIHRVALLGQQYDKEIGAWFGPGTISQVLRTLLHTHRDSRLEIHYCLDGAVYKSDVQATAKSEDDDPEWKPLLLLIPLRLGVENLNPVYHNALRNCFDIPHCVGIAGGRPNSSVFFIGYQGSKFIYLDPHYSRAAVSMKDYNSYTVEDLSSYHCPTVRIMHISNLDPSLVIGFYCRNSLDFDEFCKHAKKLTRGKTPLFTIAENRPEYPDEVEIVSDPDDM